jgi:hypothetical protein
VSEAEDFMQMDVNIDALSRLALKPIKPEDVQHTSALATQVDGSHYKDMKIQPMQYIHANGIGFAEGCVIKYVSR